MANMMGGYAYMSPEIREAHVAAWERVKELNLTAAVTSGETSYGRRTFLLDPEKTKDLTDLEKLVLADGGPSPFGGYVIDSTVVVYTD